MDLYLFDKHKEVIGIIEKESLLSYTQNQKLNDLITTDVESFYTSEIKQAQYIGSQDVDDRSNFWRYKIDEKKTHGHTFDIKGTYELFDDLKGRTVITDKRPQGWSATRGLNALLEGTGWKVGQVSTNNIASTNWYYISPLEAFWDFLDKWRVEFKPRMVFSKGKVIGKYIDIYDRLSDDYGKWYEYGDKLLTVTAEEKSNNIYTAFYGRGKGEEVGETDTGDATYGRKISFAGVDWKKSAGDPLDKPLGQEWLEFPQATSEYGYEDGTPRFTTVDFGDIEDPSELLQATYEYGLSQIRPKVQFSTNVLEKEVAELGETVAIIRDLDNIRYKTRIFELNRNFLNKNIKQIEFGDKLTKSRAEQTKDRDNKIAQQEKQTIDWLNQIRNAIVDSYFNDDGYNYELKVGNIYDLPAGYYSFDAPIDQNPTKVIYMGAGRLLIANQKKPNGDWDWKTAATGDGIVADVVNTGVLNASLVKTGMLTDRQGNTTLDLANGVLTMLHASGDYTQASSEGFMHFNAGSGKHYHHRTKIIKFNMDGYSSNTVRWIPIGEEFNDYTYQSGKKSWDAALSISDSETAPSARHSIQRIVLTQGHEGTNVLQPRKRNGQWEFPVTGYTTFNHNTTGALTNKSVAGILIITA